MLSIEEQTNVGVDSTIILHLIKICNIKYIASFEEIIWYSEKFQLLPTFSRAWNAVEF